MICQFCQKRGPALDLGNSIRWYILHIIAEHWAIIEKLREAILANDEGVTKYL